MYLNEIMDAKFTMDERQGPVCSRKLTQQCQYCLILSTAVGKSRSDCSGERETERESDFHFAQIVSSKVAIR